MQVSLIHVEDVLRLTRPRIFSHCLKLACDIHVFHRASSLVQQRQRQPLSGEEAAQLTPAGTKHIELEMPSKLNLLAQTQLKRDMLGETVQVPNRHHSCQQDIVHPRVVVFARARAHSRRVVVENNPSCSLASIKRALHVLSHIDWQRNDNGAPEQLVPAQAADRLFNADVYAHTRRTRHESVDVDDVRRRRFDSGPTVKTGFPLAVSVVSVPHGALPH